MNAKELGFELNNQVGVRVEPTAKLLPVLSAISTKPARTASNSKGLLRIGLKEFLAHRQEYKLQKLRVAFRTASYAAAGEARPRHPYLYALLLCHAHG